MMQGFTFFYNQKDYFIETKRTNKTKALAAEILPLIGCSVTDRNIQAMLYKLKRASCEIKTASNTERKEQRYYEISGDGFGGCGSWLDDGNTIILKLN